MPRPSRLMAPPDPGVRRDRVEGRHEADVARQLVEQAAARAGALLGHYFDLEPPDVGLLARARAELDEALRIAAPPGPTVPWRSWQAKRAALRDARRSVTE